MRLFSTLAPAAALVVLSSGAAFAGCPEGSEGLPNAKWSWMEGESSGISVSVDDLNQAGGSGNVFATVTTTSVVICHALNPGGNIVDSKSTTSETTTVEYGVKVCQNRSTDPLVDADGLVCPG